MNIVETHSRQRMILISLFVIIFVVSILTFTIIYNYGKWNKSLTFVFIVASLSWILSFLTNFLIPIDITSTLIRICQSTPNITSDVDCLPSHLVSFDILNLVWRFVYWTSNALSWLVIPILQCYLRSGHFTFLGRLRYSIITNMVWYGSYLLIFGCFLIYLGVKDEISWINIKTAIASASNTWSLILLVLLMGYGLVDVPRNLWRKSNMINYLNFQYFQIAKLHEEIVDNHEKLDEIIEKLIVASNQAIGKKPYQEYLEIITGKLPEETRLKLERKSLEYRPQSTQSNSEWKFTNENALVKLHADVKQTIDFVIRLENVLKNKVIDTKFLEDISSSKINASLIASLKSKPFFYRTLLKIYYYMYIKCSSVFFKILAIICVLFGFIFIWSESTFFVNDPVLSLFAIMVNSYKSLGIMYIQAITFICLAYMALCSHQTVFKLRFYSFLYFARNHQTSPYTFLFTAGLVSRLSNAICLNYLAMLHLDKSISQVVPNTDNSINSTQTSFTYIMGHLELLNFISNGFNVYYPIFILVVCISTYFSIGSRILHSVGIEQFTVKSEESEDIIHEGKSIYLRELRSLEQAELNQNNRNLNNDYSIVGRQDPLKYTRDMDNRALIEEPLSNYNDDYDISLTSQPITHYNNKRR